MPPTCLLAEIDGHVVARMSRTVADVVVRIRVVTNVACPPVLVGVAVKYRTLRTTDLHEALHIVERIAVDTAEVVPELVGGAVGDCMRKKTSASIRPRKSGIRTVFDLVDVPRNCRVAFP